MNDITPNNSSGDCISRSDLKEVISKVVAEERKEDEKWAAGLRYALKLIDNAPTVEPPFRIVGHYEIKKPQGEWKVRPHTDTDGYCDGYDVYCSECGKILFHLLNRSFSAEEAKEHVKKDFTNFCSECGADMKGGDKSLCDTCLYKHSCEDSDAGISWANHSVCYGYVVDTSEKGDANDR